MLRDELHIINKLGLHARAAAKLVAQASHHGSRVRLRHSGDWVDAKSIMAVMMLAAGQGTVLEVEVDGPDEDTALNALKALAADRFGERE